MGALSTGMLMDDPRLIAAYVLPRGARWGVVTFVSHGPDWSIKILSERDLACDELYFVVANSQIILVAGSEDELLFEIAKLVVHKQVPQRWSVLALKGVHEITATHSSYVPTIKQLAVFEQEQIVCCDNDVFPAKGSLRTYLATEIAELQGRQA